MLDSTKVRAVDRMNVYRSYKIVEVVGGEYSTHV